LENIKGKKLLIIFLILIPFLLFFISLFIGRYPLDFFSVIKLLYGGIKAFLFKILDRDVEVHLEDTETIKHTVLWYVRMPRTILALLVGASLAVSGGALQGMFRNPLVDSGMLGVSSGAGFGAAVAIVIFNNTFITYIFAFIFGIVAVILSYLTGKIYKSAPTVTLVLGGVIISSIFSALLSFIKYIADPYEQLPTIVFWLMGSLAKANYKDILISMIPMLIGVIGIIAVRWRINILSLGDREAKTLGVNVKVCRVLIVICTSLATAGAVCVSGTIGWIGLIIPHIGRMIVGNDNRVLIPTCLSIGASFMVIVDGIGRALTGSEIPLGVLTALIGGPFYIYLLKKTKGGSW
jgi:iron complex transport system permease protein